MEKIILEMFEGITDRSQVKVYHYVRFLWLKDNDMLEISRPKYVKVKDEKPI